MPVLNSPTFGVGGWSVDVIPLRSANTSSESIFLEEHQAPTALGSSSQHTELESALPTSIQNATDRLRHFLTATPEKGERKPKKQAINNAIVFLSHMKPWHPRPFATVDTEGIPIIELKDDNSRMVGALSFISSDEVRFFARQGIGRSKFHQGNLASQQSRDFLNKELGIVLRGA